MSKKHWHSSPPPSIGWWPASVCEDDYVIRWWNGKHWSIMCDRRMKGDEIGWNASVPTKSVMLIKWCARPSNWPKRSRT
jgi:hypothetical protein